MPYMIGSAPYVPWDFDKIPTALWLNETSQLSFSSGARISQVNDLSGNNRHVSQSTAGSQPLLTNAAISGLNAIYFNSARFDGLSNAASLQSDYTMIALVKLDAVPTQGMIFKNGSPTTGTGIGVGAATADNSGSNLIALRESIAWQPSSLTVSTSTAIVGFYSTTASSGGQMRVNLNGGIFQNLTNAPTVNPAVGGFSMGNVFGGRSISLLLGEIVVFPGILSDNDFNRGVGRLAHKWNIAGSLPSDHPYKLAAPTV